MSSYLLRGTCNLIRTVNIPHDAYILCVRYLRKIKVLDQTGDSQLFITGKVEGNEDSRMAIKNEIEEEACMKADVINYHGHTEYGHTEIDWYTCPISTLVVIEHRGRRILDKANQRIKVGAIIWGTRDEMIEQLNKIPVTNIQSEENIAGLVCIPWKDVKQIASIIETTKEYDCLTKFNWDGTQHTYAFRGRRVYE